MQWPPEVQTPSGQNKRQPASTGQDRISGSSEDGAEPFSKIYSSSPSYHVDSRITSSLASLRLQMSVCTEMTKTIPEMIPGSGAANTITERTIHHPTTPTKM